MQQLFSFLFSAVSRPPLEIESLHSADVSAPPAPLPPPALLISGAKIKDARGSRLHQAVGAAGAAGCAADQPEVPLLKQKIDFFGFKGREKNI